MKFCIQCGTELPEEAKICSRCGALQDTDPAAAKPRKTKFSGVATASLILSIIGFCTGFIFVGILLDVLAIILATVALSKAKKAHSSSGKAIAALCIAAVGLILCAVVFGQGPGVTPASSMLKEVKAYYEEENYAQAAAKADQLLEEYPDSRKAKKAQDYLEQISSDWEESTTTALRVAVDAQDWDEMRSLMTELQQIPEKTGCEALSEASTSLLEEAQTAINEKERAEKIEKDRLALAKAYEKQEWEDVLKLSGSLISSGVDSATLEDAKQMRKEAFDYYTGSAVGGYAMENYWIAQSSAKTALYYASDADGVREDLEKVRDLCAEALLKIGTAAVKNFRSEHDDVRSLTWYYPKNAPQYVNERSASYLYIGKYDSGKTWLRWKTIYFGDNWVFFKKIIFNVDGTNFTIPYDKDTCSRDNARGDVWEIMDFEPDSTWTRVLQLIATSEKTVIRFEGEQYYKDVTLSEKDKNGIRDVLCVYQTGAINELK